MSRNRHRGPLQVQKVLYPEGPGVCHVAVLHPPGGIASGDSLNCNVRLEDDAQVCMTTPGATKWYRCPDAGARQSLNFSIGEGGAVEWLPRENIFFDASRIRMQLDVDLDAHATFFGWEILCFGRRASGERWRTGSLELRSQIRRAGQMLWAERACVAADGRFVGSLVGLAGFTVSATFVVAGPSTEAQTLAALRDVRPDERGARRGITSLPSVMVARYLGNSSEDAFNWFTSLWRLLRPVHLRLAAAPPRLWAC